MPAMRLLPFVPSLIAAWALAACSTSPAVHSPLRERLAVAANSEVEDATRACFTKGGFTVDPIAELVNGARVVNATKDRNLIKVYISPADVKPRVAGGPDYSDPFWKCLASELGGKRTEPPAS
jgi:hypothetical protein